MLGRLAPEIGDGAIELLNGASKGSGRGPVGPKPFAIGLTDQGLEEFARARGATTWKDLPDPLNWKTGVLDKLADPKTTVHFNLEGVNVWQGVQRAASGSRFGPTDWELLQIKQNPQFWNTMQFWKGGQPAPNPFQMKTKLTCQKNDRRFQVWEYQVSHGQLLIRSPKAPATLTSPELLTNVDLVCVGVEYMGIPRSLDGIELMSPTPEEVRLLEGLLGKSIPADDVKILVSGGKRFPIVAAHFSLSENDWDIFESPFEFQTHFRSDP
jgi:hypothetical protein